MRPASSPPPVARFNLPGCDVVGADHDGRAPRAVRIVPGVLELDLGGETGAADGPMVNGDGRPRSKVA